MNSVLQRVYEIGIIPVIAFNSVDEALPLCKALMAGGLPAAEVTFRTACAEDCIKKIHEELPDMLLGAGTVLTKDQADRAMAAGASFIVAPGFDPEVCKVICVLAWAPIGSTGPLYTLWAGGDVGLAGMANAISVVAGIAIMTVLVVVLGV